MRLIQNINRRAREVSLIVCIQRAANGGNAVTKVILNGLVREARNHGRVGAYGNPVRYQWGAYDGMQNEVDVFYTSNWVVPQKF